MKNKIVEKINKEFSKGLKSEAQVVYLLSGIRKIIEQDNISKNFPYLWFHCHWTLHSELSRGFSQKVLSEFHSSQIQLLSGEKPTVDSKIKNISGLVQLKTELKEFFKQYDFNFDIFDLLEWKYFQYLYLRIIEDVPLKIDAKTKSEIVEIKVWVEPKKNRKQVQKSFETRWHLQYGSGKKTILNSYSFTWIEKRDSKK